MHPTIIELDRQINDLKNRRTLAVANLQKICTHDEVGEAPHKYHFPPMRVCFNCGLVEDGWGYLVLTAEFVKSISRDELYSKRTGMHIRDEHKGPLLRKGVTLAELIDRGCLIERSGLMEPTFWGFFHTTSIYESAPALISLHRTKAGAWKAMHKAQWDAWVAYQNHQVRRLEMDGARYRERGWKVYAHELSLVKPVTLKD